MKCEKCNKEHPGPWPFGYTHVYCECGHEWEVANLPSKALKIQMEKNKSMSFVIHGLLAVCYIDFLRTDTNGFYHVTTVIDTPRGSYKKEHFLNPEFLRDYGDRVTDFLGESCYESYLKEIEK